MLRKDLIKNLIPGIITRIAITYPFVYIDSISFLDKDKLVAACIWNWEPLSENTDRFRAGSEILPGCYVYQNMEDISSSDIEVMGRDEQGRNLLVSLPLMLITTKNGFS